MQRESDSEQEVLVCELPLTNDMRVIIYKHTLTLTMVSTLLDCINLLGNYDQKQFQAVPK